MECLAEQTDCKLTLSELPTRQSHGIERSPDHARGPHGSYQSQPFKVALFATAARLHTRPRASPHMAAACTIKQRAKHLRRQRRQLGPTSDA